MDLQPVPPPPNVMPLSRQERAQARRAKSAKDKPCAALERTESSRLFDSETSLSLAEVSNLNISLSESDRSLLDYLNPETVLTHDTVADSDANIDSSISSKNRAAESEHTALSIAATMSSMSHAADTDPKDNGSAASYGPSIGLKKQRSVTFGLETNLKTGRPITSDEESSAPSVAPPPAMPLVTAVATMDDLGHEEEGRQPTVDKFNYRPKGGGKRGAIRNSVKSKLTESILQKRSSPVPVADRRDSKFDLDGDGMLDEIEQAMRDRDKDGNGQLDNREVYQIIQDQLKSQSDIGAYKKISAGLLCLVAILALSNFGTSWATAILAKDTVAESESGTIQNKATGEIMGMQGISHLIEIEELTEDEFQERRMLVDAEMAEDPDHPDHLHRRLGKKKKNVCSCTKVAYDHGKVKERDLIELTKRCDGANTVQMKRTWTDGDVMDTTYSWDFDTVCDPGTQVIRKGKKKKNKKKTKTKVLDEQIEFRKTGKDGKKKSVTFTCDKGNCYSSGETMHQREGHPCRLERDAAGASECKQGLTCYNHDNHSATRGKGTCTRLQKLSRSNQICDISLGVDACESSYACYSTNGRGNNRISAGTVATGLCQKSVRFSRLDEICDASFGANACVDDYQCRSANGREISRGIGFCRRSSAIITAKFAKRNQACNIGHGLEACESSYACYANNGNQRIRTGICLGVVRRAGLGGVCNVSYGPDACVAGYECLGDNGRREVRGGFGVCARLNTSGRTNSGNSGGCLPSGASWAVDCTNSRRCASGSCLKNCVQGSDRYFCY